MWTFNWSCATRKQLWTSHAEYERGKMCSQLAKGEKSGLSAKISSREVKNEEESVDILVLEASVDLTKDGTASLSVEK